ncbi:MAG: 4-(cytidine 5'-diphospho)-2-C-methyl-D-erythritol kinase [Campylobacterales bacterium]|nr:4-(cytidine 5'-diphospho)-2-C-methyl-D-erythritol kinase [Campylobacterales bacterium]
MMHAHAKVNIFLKITGMRGEYHTICSRFVKVADLYDTLTLFPKTLDQFVLEGDFTCSLEANTIYKAYRALLEATDSKALESLMRRYGVRVEKRIPACGGLGGGSSDAAAFLKLCNQEAALGLDHDALAAIGARVGADVPFFIYDYNAANVRGIGEIVEAYEEEPLSLELFTPPLELSTPRVYRSYRERLYSPIDTLTCNDLCTKSSREILSTLSPKEANNLFEAALLEYGDLALHVKPHWFFSGSGSTFFRLKGSVDG